MSGTRISSLLEKITILVIICCFSISTQAKYGGGTGEPNDPYQTYPCLRTVSPGDINKDRITNFLDMSILSNQWLKEP